MSQNIRIAAKGYKGAKAKTIYVEMCIWLNSKTKQIHMAIPKDEKFHSTVSNDPKSKRYHPNLYMKLERLLKKYGMWN